MTTAVNGRFIQTFLYHESQLSFGEASAVAKKELQSVQSSQQVSPSPQLLWLWERAVRALADLATVEKDYYSFTFLKYTPVVAPFQSTSPTTPAGASGTPASHNSMPIVPQIVPATSPPQPAVAKGALAPLPHTAETLAQEFLLLSGFHPSQQQQLQPQPGSSPTSALPVVAATELAVTGVSGTSVGGLGTSLGSSSRPAPSVFRPPPVHTIPVLPPIGSGTTATSATPLMSRRASMMVRGRSGSGAGGGTVTTASPPTSLLATSGAVAEFSRLELPGSSETVGAVLHEIAIVLNVRAGMVSTYRSLAESPMRTAQHLEELASRIGKYVFTLDEQVKSPLLSWMIMHVKLEVGILNHVMCADASVSRFLAVPSVLSLCTCKDLVELWHEKFFDLVPHRRDQQKAAASAPAALAWPENRVFTFLYSWTQNLTAKALLYFDSLIPVAPPLPASSSSPPPHQQQQQQSQSIPELRLPMWPTSVVSTQPPKSQKDQQHQHQQPGRLDFLQMFETFVQKNNAMTAAIILNSNANARLEKGGYVCKVPGDPDQPPTGMGAWNTVFSVPSNGLERFRIDVVSLITQYRDRIKSDQPAHIYEPKLSKVTFSFMLIEPNVFLLTIIKDKRVEKDKHVNEFFQSTSRVLRMCGPFSILHAAEQ